MILAYDIGTTTLKIALVDKDGKFHNFKAKRTKNNIINNKAEGQSDLYLNFLSEYLQKVNTSLIEAISISSNGPSLICTFSNSYIQNNTIKVDCSPTILWLDKRGQKNSKIVSEYFNQYIDGSFPLPTILTLKEDENVLYNRTNTFFTCEGFVNFALSGKKVVTNTPKGLNNYYWDDKSIEYFKLDKSKFPKIIKSGEIISTIKEEIAKTFNLNNNVKIISGGTDFFVNILGTRANKEGILCDRSGTSEGLNLCSKEYKQIKSLMCYEHPLKGYWNLSGVISTTGAAIDWFRKVIGEESTSYSEFFKMAEKAPLNHCLIFLPYLNGERAPIWDSKAKGVLFGLTLQTKKESIAMAVLEGTQLALKDVINTMEKNKIEVKEINIAACHAQNETLIQLKSDISNKKINIVDTSNPELLGLAMLSFTKLGYFKTLNQAMEKMVKIKTTYLPDDNKKDFYDKKYKKYKRLYLALKDEF